MSNSSNFFSSLPNATKYLILSNTVILLIDYVLRQRGIQLYSIGGLYLFTTPHFHWWQPLTYMFLHGDFWHLFFNMFAVYMFAPVLEQRWGTRRFLVYYFVCGLGAAVVQQLVWYLTGTIGVTIGASGAVFGILFAFGWLYPDVELYLMFIPIPIRARIFVIMYAALELWQGISPGAGDNIAHFAHLGGMLFGWLLILYWNHKGLTGSQRAEMSSDSRVKAWLQDKIRRLKKRKDTDRKSGYSDYHYQDPISNDGASSSSSTRQSASTGTHSDARTEQEEQEINAILDKIKLHGYGSLTDEERKKIFKK